MPRLSPKTALPKRYVIKEHIQQMPDTNHRRGSSFIGPVWSEALACPTFDINSTQERTGLADFENFSGSENGQTAAALLGTDRDRRALRLSVQLERQLGHAALALIFSPPASTHNKERVTLVVHPQGYINSEPALAVLTAPRRSFSLHICDSLCHLPR